MPTLKILYEDNHLLVVDKPAGIATMGTGDDVPTVARQAAAYLKKKYHKPGKVFVGVVSRIDRLVSGVLILARTSKAASRLSEQIRNQTTSKRYLALVEGEVPGPLGQWREVENHLAKNELEQRMEVVSPTTERAQLAQLRLRPLATDASSSLVEVELRTGRKHQIRVQLSACGHPILGDRKYDSHRKFSPGIALHCYRLTVAHPTKQQAMTFESLPNQWRVADSGLWRRGMQVLSSY